MAESRSNDMLEMLAAQQYLGNKREADVAEVAGARVEQGSSN